MEAELFHADCWTDREADMKKSVTFHNFANTPKKALISSKCTYHPCVKVKPTKGRWSAVKAEFAVGGTASDALISVSSTSKLDVSVGLLTSGL